jgi:hypothetical protein
MTTERWQQLIDQLVELEVIEAGSVPASQCFWQGVEEQQAD